MRGTAVTLACFALVAALLAWSRWLARRRLPSLGHAALAVACAAAAACLWTAADGLASYEPLRSGMAVAEIHFDEAGPGHYRATLVRLPWGRVQVFELDGDSWRIEARTLDWRGLATDLGLQPAYRLERLESGPGAGATGTGSDAGRSYALARDAGVDVWTLVGGHPRWSRYAEARVTAVPWQPMADGARFSIVATADGLAARPASTEIPVVAPPRG